MQETLKVLREALNTEFRGPKVIVDNPGLKKLALERARKAREKARDRIRPPTA